MRFRPNSQASNDQAPGPINARLAASTARTAGIAALPGSEKAIHVSIIATRTPVTGVHRPTSNKTPPRAPILCGTTVLQMGVAFRQANQQ
jgi:hypothetical protein